MEVTVPMRGPELKWLHDGSASAPESSFLEGSSIKKVAFPKTWFNRVTKDRVAEAFLLASTSHVARALWGVYLGMENTASLELRHHFWL